MKPHGATVSEMQSVSFHIGTLSVVTGLILCI